MPVIDALFCEVNPIPVKAALRLAGLDVGHCRLPLTDPTPEHLELLRRLVGAPSGTPEAAPAQARSRNTGNGFLRG